MSTILAVVAHPDDEVLGLGATLARHVDSGDRVGVIYLTDGVGSRGHQAEMVARRSEARERAAAILGVETVWQGNYADNQLDALPRLQLIQAIEPYITAFTPDCLYTHHPGDLNVDHRRCAEAVLTACRPVPAASVTSLRCFSTRSATEWSVPALTVPFEPNFFVDVTDTWARKILAIEAYAEEMRPYPHSRSMEALDAESRYWGAQVGVDRAEAFVQVRQILRRGA